MKQIKRFALLVIVMISTQVYGQSDTIVSSQVDTICYIYDSNSTTVITIHPPSSKIEEEEYVSYVYKWIPTYYIPFSEGRLTKVFGHWDTIPYDTLYTNPCPFDSSNIEDY
jgi:hypothetical protein